MTTPIEGIIALGISGLILGVTIINAVWRHLDYQAHYNYATQRKYLILRKLPDADLVVDMLTDLDNKLTRLISEIKSDPTNKDAANLARYNRNTVLVENFPSGSSTSYSLNKGERIYFCMRNKRTKELVDPNVLMYVALHELAHIMTPEWGHTNRFWENVEYLITKASQMGIYNDKDYSRSPEEYCGIVINA